ncbi:MAG: gliding motility-associated C-terminal domain-containing protein [Chitinophagaceae bacterium]
MRKQARTDIIPYSRRIHKAWVCFLFAPFLHAGIAAQDCPPNIDFERGTFEGWTCYTGSVYATNNQNSIYLAPSGPMPNQHQIMSAGVNGGERDYYGHFPVYCPNGSGYSVKLGNTSGGAQAEGISYSFSIPSGRNTFSLIYHYAVVFQDPNHLDFQQPRLVLEVWNISDDELINCSSFTFFPNGSPLPGFFRSDMSDSTDVWCKDWSAVTINLNGMAGKDIRLFFKTADCTFRRHFGYAYIDVNTECSSEFTGATYCPDDTAVLVTAPYGYQSYRWFNETFTQFLGNQQTLRLEPPPPTGTRVAVQLIPYNGYGCQDTLFANLVDTLTLKANAGLDVTSCNFSPVMIGENGKQGRSYSWIPSTGLSATDISNPRASPAVTTAYEVTVRSPGGGCVNRDTVLVKASVVDSALQLIGKTNYCITSGESTYLEVSPVDSVQWFLNNSAIFGANQLQYRVGQSGVYHAKMYSKEGCTNSTRNEQISIEIPRPGIRYPIQYAVLNFPVQLNARDFGIRYQWSPGFGLDDSDIPTPNFTPVQLYDQVFTVGIETAAGCLTVDTQLVQTIKEVKVYVPSAFSPNRDGRNDLLRPIMLGIKELRYFRVFNRWGQVVYLHPAGSQGWDGTLKGQTLGTDVYVWMFEAIGLDNRKYFQKGTVLLVR